MLESGGGSELEVNIATTPAGVRYGLLGAPGTGPAPLLLSFAADLETSLGQDPYHRTARQLAQRGYLCVSLDLPCHGQDHRAGEAEGLKGWRERVEGGEDFVAPFAHQVSQVLDHLIGAGLADPGRVAACGTSRGGFMAAQVMAADSRCRAAALFAPVTSLAALSEFAGLEHAPRTQTLALAVQAPAFATRSLWVSIGHRDLRVDTDLCIAFCRRVVAAAGAGPADCSLQVLPTEGHSTPRGAYEAAADWINSRL
ncbi:MAG: alpha/beta hydrolase [Candidatus Latescibacteria bacterium]|nr:alpha/beta hydrolase [Candidatus Latescibacterota bacterium]